MIWASPPADSDGDGVPNILDSCPSEFDPIVVARTALDSDRSAVGEIVHFAISPDNSTVVFVADPIGTSERVLYSVPMTGGVPTRLSEPGLVAVDANWVRISPDGRTVVYFAVGEFLDPRELYSVPITGGTSIKLNGPLPAGASSALSEFAISLDGADVIYAGDQETLHVREVFKVPIGGGVPQKLSGILESADEEVNRFRLSPDKVTVLYLILNSVDDYSRLFSVPIAGGTQVRLAPPIDAITASAGGPLFTPDGGTVILESNHEVLGDWELYQMPVTGGTLLKLNEPLDPGTDVWFPLVSPDGATVVYQAILETGSVRHLYSVPIAGGPSTRLNGDMVPGGAIVASSIQITPDGAKVIYGADQDTDEIDELYSVPIGGGPDVKLNGPLASGGEVLTFPDKTPEFLITPDGARVIYRADQEFDDVFEIYSVPVTGGVPMKLNGPLVAGGSVRSLKHREPIRMTPDGTRVIYVADQDIDETIELYRVWVIGGPTTKLNGPMVAGGDIGSTTFLDPGFVISPDGSTVVYVADQETDEFFELYAVQAAQPDADEDGAGDACDCAPYDAATLPPAEIPGLMLEETSPGETTLAWSGVAGADRYSITRGTGATFTMGKYGECLVDGVDQQIFIDSGAPASGEAFIYWLQGQSLACGLGTLGFDSAGAERINLDPTACQ